METFVFAMSIFNIFLGVGLLVSYVRLARERRRLNREVARWISSKERLVNGGAAIRSGEFGSDDGVICCKCGGRTYLSGSPAP